ncbi:2OG-Fe(II) oxygenase [Streptomyces sp. ISL-96]|nr:2OG-Fe(II) oxygenase [Streptomyces sp. ISL-96]
MPRPRALGRNPRPGRRHRADWQALADEVNEYGCVLTQQILTPAECRKLAALYDDTERFRSTVDMARHRFGSGHYRYFGDPLPELVRELRAAFYPRLLPIARDWADKLGRPAPWPDSTVRSGSRRTLGLVFHDAA